VPAEEYLRLARDVGFVEPRVLGYTDFWTSTHTRGVDLVARKPDDPRRSSFSLASIIVRAVGGRTPGATAAAALGVVVVASAVLLLQGRVRRG